MSIFYRTSKSCWKGTVLYLLEILISLLSEMCSQLVFLSLVYPIEGNFIQSVINKEMHVIFVQLRINSLC